VQVDTIAIALGVLVAVAVVAAGAALAALRSPASVLHRLAPDAAAVDLGGAELPTRTATRAMSHSGADPGDADAASRLRRQLVWAGLRGSSAPQTFLLVKAVLAVGSVAVFTVYSTMRAEPVDKAVPIALLLAAAGFFLPNAWLNARVLSRQRQLDRGLPDALDLLVTCVEAGLGLDAAMQRVADEIALAWPLLSRELRLAFLEVKAGIPRMEAFRRLAERTGSAELRSLAATLNQTEMFGTSVGAALRVQAEGIRIRRMQRAEELAAYIAVKMTFPLIVFILPSLFVVVVGPAIVNITERLFPLLGGG
jgi:tight adherence protein C